MTEALKPRYRSNFAGVIAALKVLASIHELNDANDRRIELGQEIRRITREADELVGARRSVSQGAPSVAADLADAITPLGGDPSPAE